MALRLRPLFVAFLVLAAGCGQGRGETCQVDGDCQSGLECCGASARVRGTCLPVGERCEADLLDSGPPVDSGTSDADVDAGEVDAGETDAGEVDAGETDAGPDDAGPEDAGTVDAGEEDASVADAGDAST